MPRKLSEFFGQNVVIGCSHAPGYCEQHGVHDDEEKFYTIDINQEIQPDKCLDITQQSIPEELKNRFKICYAEGLPYFTYNLIHPEEINYFNIDGSLGLKNMLNLLDKDGFLMITGCSKNQVFRSALIQMKLRYFEAYSTKTHHADIVFVPKNQTLSEQDFKLQLQNTLEPSLKNRIIPEMWEAGYEWHECHDSYDTLPGMNEYMFINRIRNCLKIPSISNLFEYDNLLDLQQKLSHMKWDEIEADFGHCQQVFNKMISFHHIIDGVINFEFSMSGSNNISTLRLIDIQKLITHPFTDPQIKCIALSFRIVTIIFKSEQTINQKYNLLKITVDDLINSIQNFEHAVNLESRFKQKPSKSSSINVPSIGIFAPQISKLEPDSVNQVRGMTDTDDTSNNKKL